MKKIYFLLLAIVLPLTGFAQWNILYIHGDDESAISVISKDTLVAVTGYGGRIHRTSDGGQTWASYQTRFVSSWFSDVDFPSKSVGYACGGTAFGLHTNVIAKTTDGGITWDSLTANSFIGYSFGNLDFLDINTGFISGESGFLLKTTNGGTSFFSITVPTSGMIDEIRFDPSGNLYLATSNLIAANTAFYTILRSTDLGATFSTVYTDTFAGLNGHKNRIINRLFFVDAQIGYGVGGNGLFLKTTDGGLTWSSSFIYPYSNLTGLSFVNSQVGYINNAGGIYQTLDGGNTFLVQQIAPLSIIHQIAFADSINGYAVGDYGIFGTKNGGQINGLGDDLSAFQLTLFPNPAEGHFGLQVKEGKLKKVTLIDTEGRLVKTFSRGFEQMGIEELASGVYSVRVEVDNAILVRKLIKR